jgi:cytochrome c-type biogenesis protein CcmF
MITLVTLSFGLVIYRLPLLRARNELDSWVSREAAFMLNNWILLFSAFFVLFATMFPTLSEAVRGERLTVAAPFFNQWMLPIGLVLLALTGVGPLLAWRKSTLLNLRDQFFFPALAGVVVGAAVSLAGVRVWTSGLCFALSGFVVGTIAQEFWRGAGVRQTVTGTDRFTAMVGLVGRNKRRYGGYIVHVAIVLIFMGFAGEGFDQSEKASLTPGQHVQVGDYVIRYESITKHEDSQKEMVSAQVTVLRDGKALATMYPAKWFYRTHLDEPPTTEVAIRRSFAEDVYVVLAGYDIPTQRADLDLEINPLVNWVWFGFGILALGTGIALLPENAFASALLKVPANAVTTSLLLLLLVLAPGMALAQAARSDSGQIVERGELERKLEGEIMCTCGCRRPLNSCGMMNCSGHAVQTDKVRRLIAEGKTHEEIIAIFVRDAGGQDILSSPIDQGFNRLAWLLPYALAVVALGGILWTARRWSRPHTPAIAGDAGIDPALNSRLDDELRNLD